MQKAERTSSPTPSAGSQEGSITSPGLPSVLFNDDALAAFSEWWSEQKHEPRGLRELYLRVFSHGYEARRRMEIERYARGGKDALDNGPIP